MKRWVAEWIWRLALLVALAWIGWELQRLHEDLNQGSEATTTATGTPDELQGSLDDIREELDQLTQKVDAIMVVMARAK
jgi:hypothetical protein